MDKSFIEKIESLVLEADTKMIGDVMFARESYRPILPQHIETVEMSTLESLTDFIKENPQKLDLENAIITILPDFNVRLLGKVNPVDLKRTVYAEVSPYASEGFHFGRTLDVEDFIIALKTKFVHSFDWEKVFMVVKKIRIQDGVEIEDNGMTQKVTLQKGVSAASIETESIKTDYVLAPNRIYTECVQPESIFFLRISGNKEKGVYVSLHETDGGDWKKKAAQNIKKYLLDAGITLPIYM